MYKILIALLIGLILTGCSANNSNPVEDKDTEEIVEINEVEAEKENSTDEQMEEIEVPETGLSLQIPTTWDSSKYKIHKDDYSIMVIYTGEKIQTFFDVTVNGKVGSETPDVGLKSEIKTVDDWVMIISYGYDLAYAQLDEVRDSNPSDYYKMADSVQKIISSIKIVDEAKLESWFNKRNEKESKPEQTTYTPAIKAQPEYKKYMEFLEINDKVETFIKDDIDLDGKQEIVIAFGESRLTTYVLREDGDSLQEIGKTDGHGYSTSAVELVKLKGKNIKYIKTNLTNGYSLSGFALYEVDNDTLKDIAYNASAIGAGEDYLVDIDKDGYYDGFIKNRFSYDVYNYYVSTYYDWDGQKFNLNSTTIELKDYPEKPEDVVAEFLKLILLNDYLDNCDDISKRLSELNISNKQLSYANKGDWQDALQWEKVNYDVKYNGESATVTATHDHGHMELILTKVNDKWYISDF